MYIDTGSPVPNIPSKLRGLTKGNKISLKNIQNNVVYLSLDNYKINMTSRQALYCTN